MMDLAINLARERSPKTIKQALRDYGESLDDPSYHHFAYLVAKGKRSTDAYGLLFPDASVSTARKQASVLLAHPDMPGMIRDH